MLISTVILEEFAISVIALLSGDISVWPRATTSTSTVVFLVFLIFFHVPHRFRSRLETPQIFGEE
jgi:hypothetical protein